MIKLDTENSNCQLLATQKTHSNSPLYHHTTLSLSSNSFQLSNPPSKTPIFIKDNLDLHLDYLRVSSTDLSKKSLNEVINFLFSGLDTRTINKPWHPHPGTPKRKKYDYQIVSKAGIVLGVKKKAKYKGKNTRYAYDIMIDFTGAYFANLSLLKQQELIYYLSNNYKLKCHRLDVAIDDYSRELFPVGQMIIAFMEGNQYDFEVIDDSYLDIVNNKIVGTLGIGSRRSNFFVRIYTKHQYFVRWETELKRNKSQALFNKLVDLATDNKGSGLPVGTVQKALLDAAIGDIDFRDNSRYSNQKHVSKSKTKQLVFWQSFLNQIYS